MTDTDTDQEAMAEDLRAVVQAFKAVRPAMDDVVVMKVKKPIPSEVLDYIRNRLAALTGWNGLLVTVGPDEDLIVMPEKHERTLYAALDAKYGNPKKGR